MAAVATRSADMPRRWRDTVLILGMNLPYVLIAVGAVGRIAFTGSGARHGGNVSFVEGLTRRLRAAGAIDFEYVLSTWYHNFSQAYSVRHVHVAYVDLMVISECASALALDDVAAGMTGALDSLTLALTSNFAGGTVNDINCQRGNTPGATDHAISMTYCIGQTVSNVTAGITQFARSTGLPFNVGNCFDVAFSSIKVINGQLAFAACIGVTVDDLDYCERYMGYANVTAATYAVYANAACSDVVVDGVTWGFGGTIPNVHPAAGVAYIIASQNVTV